MAESTLTILKFAFLGLLYLFLLRVVHVVVVEMGGGRRSRRAAVEAPARAPRRERRRSGPDHPPRLHVLEPPERRGMVYDLGQELTVGRAPGCGIHVPDDGYVSQLHARVFTADGVPWVEDLGSTNGTHLNGSRVESPMPLHRGDHLQVGGTVMEVV